MPVERAGALMDELPQLREKRGGSGVVGKRGEGPQDILFSDREAGADGIRVDAHPLELMEQVREAFRL